LRDALGTAVTAQSTTPPLTRSDAWIAAALCESARNAPMRLRNLVADADWLNRSILTFDEVSFGLRRLEAAGLVEVTPGPDGPLVRPTPEAHLLRATVKANTLGGVLAGMDAAVGAPPYPEPESEDRTLGRLPDLDEASWRAEVAAYRREFRSDLGKFVAGAGAILVGAAAGVMAVAVRRRKR
jgi:DNA-binding MarR family transcriptional regulator